MAIVYYQLNYESRKNSYVVKRLDKTKNIDTTKINGVYKYSKNLWIARRKQDLVDYAEKLKENLIKEYEEKLKKLNKRIIES